MAGKSSHMPQGEEGSGSASHSFDSARSPDLAPRRPRLRLVFKAMAPNPLETVDEQIKRTVQSLYALQSSTHGYVGNETQSALIAEVTNLSRSLATLESLTGGNSKGSGASASALSDALLPPEVVDYVDSGRNPQIYTREFVELVQRGNSYLKGKGEALAMFRDKLAAEMTREWPEMRDDVDRAVGKL